MFPISVLAVRRCDGTMLVNPKDSVVLQDSDTLIVLGARSELERIGQ